MGMLLHLSHHSRDRHVEQLIAMVLSRQHHYFFLIPISNWRRMKKTKKMKRMPWMIRVPCRVRK